MNCTWTQDENGIWQTDCGHAFEITSGTPMDNQMIFCCYCGEVIQEGEDEEGGA